MQPNNPPASTSVTPLPIAPAIPPAPTTDPNTAAANVARSQIAQIFNTAHPTTLADTAPHANTATATIPTTPPRLPTFQSEAPQPIEISPSQQPSSDRWRDYHAAWQSYYQQFYHRHYHNELHKTKQSPATTTAIDEPLTKQQAMSDLRARVRHHMTKQATAVRTSRHFMPVAAAFAVMLIFLFLQYNSLIFSQVQAYISPGNINPANIIVDTTAQIDVGPDPKIIIPRINVEAPIVFDIATDVNSQNLAMERGVAHFAIPGANSRPGQVGNTVISGHSSNDLFNNGAYKFVFVRLEQLNNGDTIYINYQSKRYTYSITKKEIVKPNEVSKLVYPVDKPILTLITCTPIGTATNRLLVTAEQINPNPKSNPGTPAPTTPPKDNSKSSMPGQNKTIFDKLFNFGNN